MSALWISQNKSGIVSKMSTIIAYDYWAGVLYVKQYVIELVCCNCLYFENSGTYRVLVIDGLLIISVQ